MESEDYLWKGGSSSYRLEGKVHKLSEELSGECNKVKTYGRRWNGVPPASSNPSSAGGRLEVGYPLADALPYRGDVNG